MRLADFILGHMETILAKGEEFAATRVPAATSMGSLELRDHAQQILEAVASDLSAPQSAEEQANKSKGLASAPFPARETAAPGIGHGAGQVRDLAWTRHCGGGFRQAAAQFGLARRACLVKRLGRRPAASTRIDSRQRRVSSNGECS